MWRSSGVAALLGVVWPLAFAQAQEKSALIKIEPQDARRHVGKLVQVEYLVRSSKHSVNRNQTYLDSEKDFRSEKNLGVVIDANGIADLKNKRGIDQPDFHFRNRRICVTGTVTIVDGRPYIKVDKADQIRIAPGRSASEPARKAELEKSA